MGCWQTAEREIASTKDQYQPLKDQIAAMDAVSAPLKKQKDDIDEALRKAKKTLARTSVRSFSLHDNFGRLTRFVSTVCGRDTSECCGAKSLVDRAVRSEVEEERGGFGGNQKRDGAVRGSSRGASRSSHPRCVLLTCRIDRR